MGLQTYHDKRNFSKTTEPKAGKGTGKELIFVVQRHHASRLHYDFRLELDGVLKSWAVPKGPSLNPKDKRLAMMVEDHPYDYRSFEGVIPEGNYGAGVVHIFDEGTYQAISGSGKDARNELRKGLKEGNLKFRLNGKILRGEFALVRLKDGDNAWLLIKHRDEFAVDKKFDSESLVPAAIKKEGLERKKKSAGSSKTKTASAPSPAPATKKSRAPGEYKPMLAKLSTRVFDDEGWIFEKKLDGYRILATTGKSVKLTSRNGQNYTARYGPVADILRAFEKNAVLDGEMVVEDPDGQSLFQELQNYQPGKKNQALKYYVFDLLSLDGYDLTGMELVKRKQLLKALISNLPGDLIVYNEHVTGKGTVLMDQARKEGWEGIIAKDAASIYESGNRTDRWLKLKIQNSQEAVILGYSKPAGSRKYFGSLVLGMYDGDQLTYIGNCGTGFNEASLKMLYDKLSALETGHKPVKVKVNQERSVTWVKPELVCEVTFTEWTSDRILRHPVFKGLREDKQRQQVIMETTDSPSEEREETFGKKKVKLTNLNKLYWKSDKISKGQLIEYYRSVADYLLPYLKDRPLSLNRHPNGIDAPGFFQKDLDTDKIPGWIRYAPLYSDSVDKTIDYLICNDLPTLLWMVNLGCIEINPWLSTYKKPENPVFAVMDLDPNDVDDFREVVRVALTTRETLDGMGIRSFIKTSGSRGLHIFIHVGGKYDYEVVKNFIQYLGHLVHSRHADTTSLERSPSKRKKKIYLDFLQNRRGQTIAAPYSARPKPGATVSTPLEWSEVNDQLDIKEFTIFNTLDRLREKGDLWKDLTAEKADLKKALSQMQRD